MYVGTKTVKALPMTRQKYDNYRGWRPSTNGLHSAEEDGYLVEYLNGGKLMTLFYKKE